ncbi:MAG: hypothetical protein Q9P01_21255 [Anaerolineae bacterium]|nr:hypothetical protein [Anaerolineae bacterium]MDQ7037272.1 hypothetical protein [Anaerolineae bacterium]
MSQIAYRIHGDDDALMIFKRSQFFYEKERNKIQQKTVLIVQNDVEFEAALQQVLG